MKKRLTAVILAAVLAIAASFSAFAGVWDYNGGYWYFSDPTVGNGDEYLTGWQWIDGYCYYLDPDAGGAMAVTTVTPDGFPVNEVGRMTDAYGEPYYIPGWGLNASTVGPADYNYDEVYYSDYPYPLSSIWDLDIFDDLWRGRDRDRDRDRDEPRRRNPDTVIIQVEINGAQPEDPEGLPENAEGLPEDPGGLPDLPLVLPEIPIVLPEDPEELPEIPIVLPEIPDASVSEAGELPENPVINAGGTRHQETSEEQVQKSEESVKEEQEQAENSVIKAGGSEKQSETAEKGTQSSQNERSATRPQRNQNNSGSSEARTGGTQGRTGNGNATGTRNGSNNINPDLLYLLGLMGE